MISLIPKRKEIAASALLLAALTLFITVGGAVFTPKRYQYGANLLAFRAEPRDSVDVVFLGSSLVYCDIVPRQLLSEDGISAYVVAAPNLSLPLTYEYTKVLYETQSPKVLYVEVSGAEFPLYKENSTKIDILYMPQSIARIRAALSYATLGDLPALFLPLYEYHNRWSELTADDFHFTLYGYARDPERGYQYLDEAREQVDITEGGLPAAEANFRYLTDIAALAEQYGSRVVFFLSPRLNRMDTAAAEYVAAQLSQRGYELTDFNDDFALLGLDPFTDFYDARHLNYTGASKFTRYLAPIVLRELEPQHGT